METAEADPQVHDKQVEEKPKGPVRPAPPTKAIFQAAREDLVLTVEKDPHTMGPGGEKVFGLGKRVAFVDGHLRVPFKGKVKGTRGESIDAKELLLFLEGGTDAEGKEVEPHALFGNREEGFWRHHEAPPPVSEDESAELLVYAEEQDLESVEAFIEAERAGWNRAQLLEVAEGTRARIEARRAKA